MSNTTDPVHGGAAVLDAPRLGERRHSVDQPPTVYISHLSVREMFVDTTYQRDLDLPRARAMAAEWDPRLVGVIDVSERDTTTADGARYAIINGQHRHMGAKLHDPHTRLVVNIHTGLTVRDEARLFYDLDAKTRRLTRWDRWKSRRGSGDPMVRDIEEAALEAGLEIAPAMQNGTIRCVAQCEKLYKLGERALLERTLATIVAVWGTQVDAVDAPIVGGVGLLLHHHGHDIDDERLQEALLDETPRKIKARANQLGETQAGNKAKLTALTLVTTYNSAKSSKGHPKLRAVKDLCLAGAVTA